MAIDWRAIKDGYENEGVSARELADTFCCHPSTIRKKAKKENWVRPSTSKKAASKSKADAEARTSSESGGCCEFVSEHRKLWEELRSRIGRDIESKSTFDFKDLKQTAEALSKIFRGEREAWGVGNCAAEVVSEVDDEEVFEVTREMEQATVPRGSGKALEGG